MSKIVLIMVMLLVGGLFAGLAFASDSGLTSLSSGQEECADIQLTNALTQSLEASYASNVAAYTQGSCWWVHKGYPCGSCTRDRRRGGFVVSEYWCWQGSLPHRVFRGVSCEFC